MLLLFPSIALKHLEVQSSNRKNFLRFVSSVRQPFWKPLYTDKFILLNTGWSDSKHVQIFIVVVTSYNWYAIMCTFVTINCTSRAYYDWKLVSGITLIMVQEVCKISIVYDVSERFSSDTILPTWVLYSVESEFTEQRRWWMENLASDKQVTVKKKISGKNDTTCSSFRDEVFIKVNGTSIQSELYIIFCLLQYCKY